MPYRDYRPELMGLAELSPTGAFEAGSYQSFTLVYTAGRFGIDDQGSLKIALRFASDQSRIQFDDPRAPGYTTVEASNGAELDCRYEFRRDRRQPGHANPAVQLLEPGAATAMPRRRPFHLAGDHDRQFRRPSRFGSPTRTRVGSRSARSTPRSTSPFLTSATTTGCSARAGSIGRSACSACPTRIRIAA